MSRRLLLRPWLAAAFGIVSLVLLTGIVMVQRFDESFSRMLRERFTVVLGELGDAIEKEMSLGLPMSALPGVAAALAEEASTHEEIVLIEVFKADGTVAFSTEISFVGDVVQDPWMDAVRASGEGAWFLADRDRQTLGRSLRGETGAVEGGIGLTYRADWIDGIPPQTWQTLILSGLALTCAGLLAAALGLALLLGPASRLLSSVQVGVDRLRQEARADGLTAAEASAPAETPEVEASPSDPARFLSTARAAYRAIGTARTTVQTLDREV